MTKYEIRKMVKGIAPYERYRGGYILHSENSNYDCKSVGELVNNIYNELKDNPNQSLSVTTFKKVNGEWVADAPETIKDKTEAAKQTSSAISNDMRAKVMKKYSNDFKMTVKEIIKMDLMPIYSYLNSQYFLDKNLNEKLKNIKWSKRLSSSAGSCSYSGIIKLSVDYHRKFPEEIKGTLAHEMIHLYVKNHGKEFVEEMERVNREAGFELVIKNSQERANVNWVSICPNHGVTGTRTRKPTARYVCSNCKEKIEWIEIT